MSTSCSAVHTLHTEPRCRKSMRWQRLIIPRKSLASNYEKGRRLPHSWLALLPIFRDAIITVRLPLGWADNACPVRSLIRQFHAAGVLLKTRLLPDLTISGVGRRDRLTACKSNLTSPLLLESNRINISAFPLLPPPHCQQQTIRLGFVIVLPFSLSLSKRRERKSWLT